MSTGRRPRVSIERRREQILAAALKEFSHKGLHGGSTVTIAKDVEISHPNLFRVFSTKKGLFVAVLERVFATVERDVFLPGEKADTEHLETMANAWGVLMEQRELMLMLLQGYASCEDPDIRDMMHGWTKKTVDRFAALPGAGADVAHDFFAAGMLFMVGAALDLPAPSLDDPERTLYLSRTPPRDRAGEDGPRS
ncbi:TetR/AcrR family transcriptional regulator [Nocardiopsis mangrovi]|uniref:TetR/AcrR family transcriptional regulator n=1 Tax=Nocardiopsis mangrovi TaxID=1179818 RepID=A0ABV9DVI0_9ACTN